MTDEMIKDMETICRYEYRKTGANVAMPFEDWVHCAASPLYEFLEKQVAAK